MRGAAWFVGALTLLAGCVLEDKPVNPDLDGSVEAGPCVACPIDRPVCNDALQCVQCTSDERGYCTDQGLVCNTTELECVQCLDDAQCTTPGAARCDLELLECVECNDNAQCSGIDGLPGDDNACDEGLCVDCTPALESETCTGGTSCNPRTKQCTDTVVGSLGVCEECVADSECGEAGAPSDEYRCVPMTYQGEPFPDGETGFCLKTTAGGCEQPYSITLSGRTSLSSSSVDSYCGINELLATCPAVRALVENQQCPDGTADQCPQPSGLCERVGDLGNRCTYRCSDAVECKEPPVPGSTCGSSGGGGDDYCGG